MMFQNCPHEKDLREMIARGQWPLTAGPEFRAHVGNCRRCSDLALVAGAFRQARAESLPAARLVSPSVLQWCAQLRRRNAAIERLERPLLGAQIFALAVALAACVGFTGFEARHGVAWLNWVGSLSQEGLHLSALFSTMPELTWLVLFPALATLALLGGVTVYMTGDRH
ncbi:MAG: hypothetical protein ABSF23_09545 [Terracidiphilus sp.]|jgi:hypothetical protein